MVRAAVFLLLALSLAACGARQHKTERKGRIITLTDTILDTGGTDTVRFGRLHSGETAVLRLWLANEAVRPVAVTKYERSCRCTTLEYVNQPIKPGEAQQVTLTFDTRGERGWQLKTLDITLAGARKPLRLFVEAEVE